MHQILEHEKMMNNATLWMFYILIPFLLFICSLISIIIFTLLLCKFMIQSQSIYDNYSAIYAFLSVFIVLLSIFLNVTSYFLLKEKIKNPRSIPIRETFGVDLEF